jgi:hypothetical protein
MAANWRTVLLGAAAALVVAAPALAEPLACPTEGLTVEAADPVLAARVCGIAAGALGTLASCHLPQRRPILIEIVARIEHSDVECLGAYDCRSARLRVTAPAALPEPDDSSSPFLSLPPDELFASLVTHELTHAMLDQQDCAAGDCIAAHEYMAYAMQMQALSPSSRQIVLDAAPGVAGVVLPERLNDFIALAAPDTFAAWAWLHFSTPGNGCAFFARLLSGEVSLEMPDL